MAARVMRTSSAINAGLESLVLLAAGQGKGGKSPSRHLKEKMI
jgi:hypothetical protein